MENLPEAISSEIVRRLTTTSDRNSVSLVSRQLYKIEADQRDSIRIRTGLDMLTKSLASLCLRFTNLTKFEINYSHVSFGLTKHENGEWVKWSGKEVDDEGLFILSTNCKFLTDLTLSYCSFITGSGLSHLASCMKLIHLKIIRCRRIDGDNLMKLGNCLGRLERLEHDSSEGRFRQQICCDKLKELGLLGYFLPYESGPSLTRSFSSLEMVYLDDCIDLIDSDLISLTQKAHGLKSISLTSFSVNYLTDTGFKALSRNCPSLESVEFAIASYAPGFESTSITIDGILALVNGCSIRVLMLRHAHFLDDSAMEALSSTSPHLGTLEIEKVHNVTNLGIGFVINFPRLVNLRIIYCDGISNDGLKPLIESKKLDYLMVKRCPYISEEGVQGAARCVCYEPAQFWQYI